MSDFDPDGLDAVPARAVEAAAALSALRAPAEQAARAIDEAFAKAGTGLAKSLAHAAADGKVSLAELARAVLDAVSSGLGGSGGGGGLVKALAGAVGSVFSGARADGGPVSAGGAYLVGERGPELFRPAGAGAVEPLGGRRGQCHDQRPGRRHGGPGPLRRPTGPGPGPGGQPGRAAALTRKTLSHGERAWEGEGVLRSTARRQGAREKKARV
jgi:hypothetical protein